MMGFDLDGDVLDYAAKKRKQMQAENVAQAEGYDPQKPATKKASCLATWIQLPLGRREG